jgi:antitoxin FitA
MSKMIQIRNVPDALHRKLRARAARSGRSLSDYLLAELTELARQPTLEELFERISHREAVEPSEPTAAAVRAERDAR